MYVIWCKQLNERASSQEFMTYEQALNVHVKSTIEQHKKTWKPCCSDETYDQEVLKHHMYLDGLSETEVMDQWGYEIRKVVIVGGLGEGDTKLYIRSEGLDCV